MTLPSALYLYWHRGWSAFMVIGFGIMTVICLAMAIAAWPDRTALFLFTAVFTLLMGAGLLRGLRLFVWPPLMLHADSANITLYYQGGRYQGPGVAIPWTDIDELELVSRTETGGDINLKSIAVVLHIKKEAAPPPSTLSLIASADPRSIYVDASTGNLRGQALLQRLKALHGSGIDA